jgi:hypothetical protein
VIFRVKARDLPARVATGAYILHTGLEKWHADEGTPAMHKPGSVWPTQAGTGVSKDVWMLGIGLGLMAGAVADDKD